MTHLMTALSNGANFRVSGKANRHNTRIWGTGNPHVSLEHVRYSPKVNVFSVMSKKCVYRPFFFEGTIVNGDAYIDILENWSMDHLHEGESEVLELDSK